VPVAVWLPQLPQSPLLEGTSEQGQDQTVSFPPDAGPGIVWGAFTKPVKVASYGLAPLRDYQRDLLDNWIEVTLVGNTQPFDWTSAAWSGATFRFRLVGLPKYDLLLPVSVVAEAASSESPVAAGYPTYTGKLQRKWRASITLARFPWYPV
jgi:hypothetical protein